MTETPNDHHMMTYAEYMASRPDDARIPPERLAEVLDALDAEFSKAFWAEMEKES